MKYDGFDFSLVTACGQSCVCCDKKENGLCQGCIESDGHCVGNEYNGLCPIYDCTRRHGVQFCGLCPEFPCNDLPSLAFWRSDIVEHQTKLAEIYEKYGIKD